MKTLLRTLLLILFAVNLSAQDTISNSIFFDGDGWLKSAIAQDSTNNMLFSGKSITLESHDKWVEDTRKMDYERWVKYCKERGLEHNFKTELRKEFDKIVKAVEFVGNMKHGEVEKMRKASERSARKVMDMEGFKCRLRKKVKENRQAFKDTFLTTDTPSFDYDFYGSTPVNTNPLTGVPTLITIEDLERFVEDCYNDSTYYPYEVFNFKTGITNQSHWTHKDPGIVPKLIEFLKQRK